MSVGSYDSTVEFAMQSNNGRFFQIYTVLLPVLYCYFRATVNFGCLLHVAETLPYMDLPSQQNRANVKI